MSRFNSHVFLGAGLALLVSAGGIACSMGGKSEPAATAPPPQPAKTDVVLASDVQTPRSGITTGPSVSELRTELYRSKAQINSVLDAMNQMAAQGGGDLRTTYDEFAREVDATQAQSDRVRNETEEMRSRGRDYFRAWQEQSLQISDPEIRPQAEQRRSAVRGDFTKLVGTMHQARRHVAPFMSDLNDIRRYLSTDLTPKGVTAIGPAIQKANQEGAAVHKRLDAVIAELDQATAEMQAASEAPAPQAGGTDRSAPSGTDVKQPDPQTGGTPRNTVPPDGASK